MHFTVAICHSMYHCFLTLTVEAMVPPSGMQKVLSCIHTYVAQLNVALLTGGEVGMYILQPETLTGRVFPHFLPVGPLTREQMLFP